MPQSETSPTPALPSVRPTKRPLRERMQWPLTGLGLALLVLLVLPSAQIRLGASQLHGLIGSYTTNGHTWQVSYSSQGNTTWTARGSGGGSQTWDPAGNGDTLPNTSGLDAKCIGTVTPTLTWVPTTGQTSATDPPPSQVLVTETGYAYFNGGGVRTDHGTLNDGWSADTPPDSPNNIYGPHYYYNTSGTHYEVKDGTSGTITVGPFSLNASTPVVTDGTVGNDVIAVSASVTVSGATAPVSVTGDSTVDTAGWDPTHPRFFSGTNCKATGTGSALSGYVQQATLSIGGTTVKQYNDTGTHQSSISLSAYFDSTHFSDSSPISITMSVTGSGGNSYSSSPVQANAYNKPYSLGNYQPTGGELLYGQTAAQNASAQFNAMSYAATPPNTTDGKGAILNNLPTYTAFYMWTHGQDLASQFGDCFAHSGHTDPRSTDANYLFARASDDTTGAQGVAQAVGNKTPVQPPYNFVFMDACSTSQNDIMAGAFGITTSSTNLAYLGYTTEVDDSPHNADWSNRIMTDMAGGSTIADAVTDANHVVGYPIYNGQYAATYIWGDKATKVHGVFGGSGGQWFR